MGHWAIILAAGIALGAIGGWLWRRARAARQLANRQLAQHQFGEQRAGLGSVLLQAAAKTGKPRGLSWENCELGGDPVFAIDRVSGEFYALVSATISFAAIPGGGMEEVEAVGNLRYATAAFVYRAGHWQSDGQVIFNLNPPQALEHYAQSLAPLTASA